ncbi:MAG: P-loop NTPase fold protein [Clostridia bacterium]|nr:P-loop NTPase fold protein [Clostridia bacterium]
MIAPNECPTYLISDDPAQKDEFGSHERIAHAIERIISTEDGGKTIGIEGGWGSGKSTVIKILCDKLEKNSNKAIIVFDAWAHEGDPLRRTFLEALIFELGQKGFINPKKWEKRREELAKRRKISEKKTTPQPTYLGKWVGSSMLVVPIGAGGIPNKKFKRRG